MSSLQRRLCITVIGACTVNDQCLNVYPFTVMLCECRFDCIQVLIHDPVSAGERVAEAATPKSNYLKMIPWPNLMAWLATNRSDVSATSGQSHSFVFQFTSLHSEIAWVI